MKQYIQTFENYLITEATWYEILGLSKEDSEDNDKVKRAYREMAMKYHPDRNPNDINASEMMQRINKAFQEKMGDDEHGRGNSNSSNFKNFNPFKNNEYYNLSVKYNSAVVNFNEYVKKNYGNIPNTKEYKQLYKEYKIAYDDLYKFTEHIINNNTAFADFTDAMKNVKGDKEWQKIYTEQYKEFLNDLIFARERMYNMENSKGKMDFIKRSFEISMIIKSAFITLIVGIIANFIFQILNMKNIDKKTKEFDDILKKEFKQEELDEIKIILSSDFELKQLYRKLKNSSKKKDKININKLILNRINEIIPGKYKKRFNNCMKQIFIKESKLGFIFGPIVFNKFVSQDYIN